MYNIEISKSLQIYDFLCIQPNKEGRNLQISRIVHIFATSVLNNYYYGTESEQELEIVLFH